MLMWLKFIVCSIVLFIDSSTVYADIEYTINVYNDVVAHFIDAGETEIKFEQTFIELQNYWKKKNYKALWFTLPTRSAQHISTLLKYNLVFHHASSSEIIMIGDVREGGMLTLPVASMQRLSSLGLVIDENNNVLVVKELYLPELGYKLPGGYADPGEHIGDCACREVKEETGVDCECIGIIGWRHHALRKGSNSVGVMTFGCLLKPLSHSTHPQEGEISEVRWMPYDEFRSIARDTTAQFLQAYEQGIVFVGRDISQDNPLMLYTANSLAR